MPHCSSNLREYTRNNEIRCSTKNSVQDIDDHYEQNLLFQAEILYKIHKLVRGHCQITSE